MILLSSVLIIFSSILSYVDYKTNYVGRVFWDYIDFETNKSAFRLINILIYNETFEQFGLKSKSFIR